MQDMKQYTKEELRKALNDSYPYACREAHGVEDLQTTYIATVQSDDRRYDLYVDEDGNYWNSNVRVFTERGLLPEFEAIFGFPEWQMKYRNEVEREPEGMDEAI